MNDYVIKINNNFIGIDNCGRYTEVSDFNQAIKGPIHKVTNIINNCVAPNKRRWCKAVLAKDVRVKKSVSKLKVEKSSSYSSLFDEVIKSLKAVDVTGYDKDQGELSQKLSHVDQEISDIQHYIEFNTLNAAEGYKAFKMLQDKLQERRVIKDDFLKFQILSNAKVSDIFDGTLDKSLEVLENRTYTPRVLKELFRKE